MVWEATSQSGGGLEHMFELYGDSELHSILPQRYSRFYESSPEMCTAPRGKIPRLTPDRTDATWFYDTPGQQKLARELVALWLRSMQTTCAFCRSA